MMKKYGAKTFTCSKCHRTMEETERASTDKVLCTKCAIGKCAGCKEPDKGDCQCKEPDQGDCGCKGSK